MRRKNLLWEEMLFPGGKTKAFTMSYDDGTIHDRRLVEIMNRYGIRGTFNLNSAFLDTPNVFEGPRGVLDFSRISSEELVSLYAGHEVAGHGLNHASPVDIGISAFTYETVEDKAALERITGGLVRGYAYPFGLYNEDAKAAVHCAGYHYARTTKTTDGFALPGDFLEWEATCHHSSPRLMELAEEFCRDEMFSPQKKLFYLWGHSHEFASDGSWEQIEALCAYLQAHGKDIWFATNIEIYDYVTAYRSLEYSAEGTFLYNPSALEVFLKRDGITYSVAPLHILRFPS